MDAKKLVLELIEADYESDVIDILQKEGLWDRSDVWKVYGNRENNYSVIGNQQTEAVTALVENIVNSADAVLMSRCKREGLDPSRDHDKTPKSIKDAVKRYFGIGESGLSGITSAQRTKLAEETCGIVATGGKDKPSYVLFDFGEGQSPEQFEKTFLSLNESNKLNVPFVQGKFNQGSTGVLRFCGESGLKLILSKKDSQINPECKWSFTIIRRFHPEEGSTMRSSVFKYLCPGELLSFEGDPLNILPGKYPEKTGREMLCGTYIKLYDYDIGPGLKTNILFDLNYRLSSLLIEPILPIRLYERRKFSGHTMETTLSGLELRLEDDRDENVEPDFPCSGQFETTCGKFSYKIFALKKSADKKRFSGNDGIIFTINGQAHGSMPRAFFSRKSVGMAYLVDSIIINVDCSRLKPGTVEKIFMSSRDRLSWGPETREIEENLVDIVKNNGNLRDLKNRRRKNDLEEQVADSKITRDIFQKIIKASPVLSKLLISGERLSDPFAVAKDLEGKAKFEGKKYPTFFTLVKPYPITSPKDVEIGRKARIQFKTDVANDYLERGSDKGDLQIICKNQPDLILLSSTNAHNGIFTLNLALPDSVEDGDIFEIQTILNDPTLVDPFINEFHVKAVPQKEHGSGKKGDRKEKTDKDNEGNRKPDGFALPNITEIHQDKWAEHGFDKHSAMRIVDAGEDAGWDFYINMDNLYLLTEIKNSKTEKIVLENRFKIALVFIGVAILSDSAEGQEDSPEKADQRETPEQIVASISKSLSMVILPLINQLASLDDASASSPE